MSDIQRLGSGQSIRPSNAVSAAPLRPAAESEGAPSFGSDGVDLGARSPETVVFEGLGGGLFMQDFEPVMVPLREAAQVKVEAEAIEGFFVAGMGPAEAGLARGSGVGAANPTGPIAMIDEPRPEETTFPDLDLNGPGSAHLGLWSMGGSRIA